jgi:hypothetical protein
MFIVRGCKYDRCGYDGCDDSILLSIRRVKNAPENCLFNNGDNDQMRERLFSPKEEEAVEIQAHEYPGKEKKRGCGKDYNFGTRVMREAKILYPLSDCETKYNPYQCQQQKMGKVNRDLTHEMPMSKI